MESWDLLLNVEHQISWEFSDLLIQNPVNAMYKFVADVGFFVKIVNYRFFRVSYLLLCENQRKQVESQLGSSS